MPRRYIHSMTIPGSSGEADTVELRSSLERGTSIGMTVQAMEGELAMRTGFEDAVRNWIKGTQIPNGMVRKIILSSAKSILDEGRHGRSVEGAT